MLKGQVSWAGFPGWNLREGKETTDQLLLEPFGKEESLTTLLSNSELWKRLLAVHKCATIKDTVVL